MRVIHDGPPLGWCCLCGGKGLVKFCAICQHSFCENCRGKYWERGVEFVKELVGRSTLHCRGESHART